MTEPSFWVLFWGSGAIWAVFTALITAYFTKKSNDKNASLKYVTEERQKWRNRIKEIASEIYINKLITDEDKTKFNKLSAEFRLNMNPYPLDQDNDIVHKLQLIEINPNDKQHREEFVRHVAYMLKHDWQRSKVEAGIRESKVERKRPF